MLTGWAARRGLPGGDATRLRAAPLLPHARQRPHRRRCRHRRQV